MFLWRLEAHYIPPVSEHAKINAGGLIVSMCHILPFAVQLPARIGPVILVITV